MQKTSNACSCLWSKSVNLIEKSHVASMMIASLNNIDEKKWNDSRTLECKY